MISPEPRPALCPDDPAAGGPGHRVKRFGLGAWAVRLSWPVLGGAWGAWVGLAGYQRVPGNPDTFGSLLAMGAFGVFSVVGLLVGVVTGAAVGGLSEALLKRLGAGLAAALAVATVLSAVALWLIADQVRARYPGLRAVQHFDPARQDTVPRPSCAQPPAEGSQERKSWELECR